MCSSKKGLFKGLLWAQAVIRVFLSDDCFSALSGHFSTGLVGQTERYCLCRDAPGALWCLLRPGFRALLSSGVNSVPPEWSKEKIYDQITENKN